MRAARNGANKGSPEPATPGSAAAWSNSPGAFCGFRRRARWHANWSLRSGALSLLANHWRASSYVQRPERAYRNEHTTQHHFRRSRWLSTTAELTIRGGGKPYSNMALDADRKNGPAARSFAADAHDCIMVRIKRPYRIQVCGTKMRPKWRAPLGSSKDRQAPSDAEATQKESPSRSSSSLRVLRRQGAAKHKRR